MGGAVQQISNTVSSAGNAIGQAASGNIGGAISSGLSAGADAVGVQFDPTGLLTGSSNPSAPSSPGINPTLSGLQTAQANQAQQFTQNLPQMQQQLTGNLKQSVNAGLGQNLQNTSNSNAARGLLYGGVNQGEQQQNYANAQAQTASGVSDINAGLQSAAAQLDANAVGTGTGIQQSSQDIQNQLYAQTMAQVNGANSMLGSAAGFGLLGALKGVV